MTRREFPRLKRGTALMQKKKAEEVSASSAVQNDSELLLLGAGTSAAGICGLRRGSASTLL